MKRNKAVIAGVLCGVAAAACVFMYAQNIKADADAARAETLARYGGEQVEVCVAKRDIAAGEAIDAASIETKLWVADLLPANSIRNPNDVIGTKASSLVLAGEVLSTRRFQGDEVSLDVPSGKCAVSLAAKDVQAVGGAVCAGSVVDIYATGQSSTEALAKNVTVLATSSKTNSQTSSDSKTAWVTVAIASEQAEELVAAAQKTDIYFTLPATTGTN